MENKPQWLIDAEAALEEFNQSEIAKKTDYQIFRKTVTVFNDIERQSLNGKAGGKALVESGKAVENLKKATEAAFDKKAYLKANKAAVDAGAPSKAGSVSGKKVRTCPFCNRNDLLGNLALFNHKKHCLKNPLNEKGPH
jgi:hypothetical protein